MRSTYLLVSAKHLSLFLFPDDRGPVQGHACDIEGMPYVVQFTALMEQSHPETSACSQKCQLAR